MSAATVFRLYQSDVKWIATMAISLLSVLGSGYLAYSAHNGVTDNRLTTLETQRTEDEKRLQRIEAKLDRLIERDSPPQGR